jgi:membrane-associated phospholipid phosphatase
MDQLNNAILVGMAEWRSLWLNRALIDITSLGSMTIAFLISAAAFAVLWTIPRNRGGAATIVTATVGAEIWVEILKRIFREARPTTVAYLVEFTGFSFPSGHAMVATATYGALAAVTCGYIHRPSGRIAVQSIRWTLVALVAISRVYLGVHYPTDVAGGVLFGMAWLYLTMKIWGRS